MFIFSLILLLSVQCHAEEPKPESEQALELGAQSTHQIGNASSLSAGPQLTYRFEGPSKKTGYTASGELSAGVLFNPSGDATGVGELTVHVYGGDKSDPFYKNAVRGEADVLKYMIAVPEVGYHFEKGPLDLSIYVPLVAYIYDRETRAHGFTHYVQAEGEIEATKALSFDARARVGALWNMARPVDVRDNTEIAGTGMKSDGVGTLFSAELAATLKLNPSFYLDARTIYDVMDYKVTSGSPANLYVAPQRINAQWLTEMLSLGYTWDAAKPK